MNLSMVNTVDIAFTAIYFIALICINGALLCRLWIFPNGIFKSSVITKKWNQFFLIYLSVMTLSIFCLFVTRSFIMNNGEFNNVFLLFSTVLWKTHFGNIELLRFIVLAIIWIIFIYLWNKQQAQNTVYGLLLFNGLIMTGTTSAISHAADQGDFSVKLFVDWLHITAASAWGGGIVTTILCLLSDHGEMIKKPSLFVTLINRLSFSSMIDVGVILFTGMYNSFWMLGGLTALWSSTAGVILCIKLFFVTLMILTGAINRCILVPRLHFWALTSKSAHVVLFLKATLITETCLLILILTLAAILIHTAPVMTAL